MFTFAHIADCHIGGWRDPKLRDFSYRAFSKAVDTCIEKQVAFILIAGDLFHTAIPGIDNIKMVVRKLKLLQQNEIQVYVIAGSHDYSPSGRTILDVFEEAGLLINVFRGEAVDGKLNLSFTIDKKTGTRITGILGKAGGLDISYYHDLDRVALEKEKGFKIFMLHCALTELKPSFLKDVASMPISFLPKGFDYYAAGHVHVVNEHREQEYPLLVYPGPLFPNSFSELEKLGRGGFYLVHVDDEKKITPEYIHLVLRPVQSMKILCDGLSPDQVTDKLLKIVPEKNAILLLRLKGILASGSPTDIAFGKVYEHLYKEYAYMVLRNTYKLSSKEFEHLHLPSASKEDIEEKLIHEQSGKFPFRHYNHDEKALIKSLFNLLSQEKLEGERVVDFEARLKKDTENIFLESVHNKE